MASVNPTVHTAATAALEQALNRALQLDPRSGEQLAALTGKVFQLRCSNPALELFLFPDANGIKLTGYWDGDITTGISGQAADFAELATAADPATALINGNLELAGDSAPLIELQSILAGLDMDWEAPLVNNLGDVVGHQLAQGLRGLFGWGQQASASFIRQLDEFIHEEARLAPPRQEVEDFYQDLEQLNLRVDRLQARLRKLTVAYSKAR
ncbi:MAG: SCP2 sterol-binding domain-containing protein [Gammaproteobacteria bacterium]|nr:SCP2 sterol-binding domain-containing protein [Gammaproteobacteria bacterium]